MWNQELASVTPQVPSSSDTPWSLPCERTANIHLQQTQSSKGSISGSFFALWSLIHDFLFYSQPFLWGSPAVLFRGSMTGIQCVTTLSCLCLAASPLLFSLWFRHRIDSTNTYAFAIINLYKLLCGIPSLPLGGGLWLEDLLATIYCICKWSSLGVQHPVCMKPCQVCQH